MTVASVRSERPTTASPGLAPAPHRSAPPDESAPWPTRLALVALVAAVGARLGGAPGAFGAATVLAAAPFAGRRLRRQWAARHYDDELVRLLRAVARGLRSGATLRVAVLEAIDRTAGPLADDLHRVAGELDDGVVGALERWAARRPLASVRLVAGGLALGHVTGGISARIVDSLADSIRLRLDGRDEAVTLSTQAAVSAVVMSGVPLAFLAVGALGDGASARFLLHDPVGRICLAVGLVLDAAALAWMLRIVRSVER